MPHTTRPPVSPANISPKPGTFATTVKPTWAQGNELKFTLRVDFTSFPPNILSVPWYGLYQLSRLSGLLGLRQFLAFPGFPRTLQIL